ncbi:MAG: magnesium transporter [Phycisphaera sp.]|nr:magnesium transporter [Phycisphaera sp.]
MAETTLLQPWEQIARFIDQEQTAELEAFLHDLPSGEMARAISRLDSEHWGRLLMLVSHEVAARVLDELTHAQAAEIIEDLPAEKAAAIIEEMPSDEQADLIAELDTDEADAIIEKLSPEERADVRLLSKYGKDTAGGLMITEYLAFTDDQRAEQVIQDLRRNADEYAAYDVQYVYVIAKDTHTLRGVVRLRDLVLAPHSKPVTEVMLPNPVTVVAEASLDELEEFFDKFQFFAAPVLDEHGRLIGVVRRAAVNEALGERSDKALMRLGGIIGGEELRTMSTSSRTIRRLAFLVPNILLNLVAVSVIASNEWVIEKVTALAIFLPILSDMSGCAGNQAVAVSMRELSLGLVKPQDAVRTLFKEITVGMFNGIVLGLLVGLIAWLMRGHEFGMIGVVIGLAMMINSIVAVCVGGCVPLLLKKLKFDPALASGPILTTCTDMCGFFLTILFARLIIIPYLPTVTPVG